MKKLRDRIELGSLIVLRLTVTLSMVHSLMETYRKKTAVLHAIILLFLHQTYNINFIHGHKLPSHRTEDTDTYTYIHAHT